MNFTRLSAKGAACLRRVVKNNIPKGLVIIGSLLASVILPQAHAAWTQVTGINLSQISAVTADRNSATGTVYVGGATGTTASLFQVTNGIGTQATISNLPLANITAMAVLPNVGGSSTSTQLIVSGRSTSTTQLKYEIYLVNTATNSATNITGTASNLDYVKRIVTTQTNVYLVDSSTVYSAPLSNVSSGTTPSWSNSYSNPNSVDNPFTLAVSVSASDGEYVIVNAYNTTPIVYIGKGGSGFGFSNGLTGTINGQIQSMSSVGTAGSQALIISTSNNTYKCTIASSTFSCLQYGSRGYARMASSPAVGSNTIYGVTSQGTLESTIYTPNSTNTSWTLVESASPTGAGSSPGSFDGLAVSVNNSIFFALNSSQLYYSGGTGTGPITTGTNVTLSSVTMSAQSVLPSSSLSATVNLKNSGTANLAGVVTVTVNLTNATVRTVPTECQGGSVGSTNLTCNISTLTNSGSSAALQIPLTAGANLGAISVNATVTANGETNTADNSGTGAATISNTASPNTTGNVQPVYTGPQSINIDLSSSTPATGVLSYTDSDGDQVTFTVATQPTKGQFVLTGTNWQYTPDKNLAQQNSTDYVVLSMSDGVSTAKNVQILFSFQGNSSSGGGGGALQPLMLLASGLVLLFIRRKNWV